MLSSHTNEGLSHNPHPQIRVHLEERKVHLNMHCYKHCFGTLREFWKCCNLALSLLGIVVCDTTHVQRARQSYLGFLL